MFFEAAEFPKIKYKSGAESGFTKMIQQNGSRENIIQIFLFTMNFEKSLVHTYNRYMNIIYRTFLFIMEFTQEGC